MINVSNKFKQALLDDKRQFQIEATITLIDDTELTITNSELWSQGFEIDTSVSGNNSFDIGGLIIGRMTLVINNIYEDYTQYDFFDADVDVTLTLPFDDGTSESIVFDNFIVDEATDNESQIVLTCLDNAKHFERPYSESNLVYPASVDTIVRDACDTCGVPLLTTSIRNGNYVVPTRPSSDGLTFLKVVSWCAQLTGNFARIDNHGQLVVGWYDRNTYDSVNKTNGTEWTITGNTAKKFHHIVSWSSLTVGTDDVTVTGLRVVATSSDNTEFVGFYGSEGYVLEVRGNDLIGVSDVQNIANSIGANVVGLKLRTYNGACLGDPTIEASDLAWITDRKNRSYKTLICGTSFKLGQYQSLYCGAATPSKRASASYSESTRAIVKTRQEIKKSLADYDSRVSSMAELIARGFGMYFTPVTQQDGSVIPYIHDEPTIEESSYIAYMTSQGIMMESDGSTSAAVDRNGNALLNTLTARGINADWINSGAISIRDTQGNETFYANCLTGVVRINATSFSLTGSTVQQIAQEAVDNIRVGGRNLLLDTATPHSSRSDNPGYISNYSVSDYGRAFFNDTETVLTLSFDYEIHGDYSSASSTSRIYAMINGTACNPANAIYIKDGPRTGHYTTTCTMTQAQVETATYVCRTRWNGIVSGCTYTVTNFKAEVGNVATDWTPAPEDITNSIDNISIGGRNLLLDSEKEVETPAYESGTAYTPYYYVSEYGKPFVSQEGTIVTLSCEFEVTGNESSEALFRGQLNNNAITGLVNYGTTANEPIPSTSYSGIYRRSFTVNSTQATNADKRVRFGVLNNATPGTVLKIRKVKLELGNRATDWTLAPEDVETTISDSINVGGRNLLFDGNFTNDFAKWGAQSQSGAILPEITTEDGIKCCHYQGTVGKYAHIYQSVIDRLENDEVGQRYTVSFDMKMTNYTPGTTNPYVKVYFSGRYDDNGTLRALYAVYPKEDNDLGPYSDKGWVHVVISNIYFNHKPSTTMNFFIYSRDWSGDLYFTNLKLERGNKATDFTLAPEDVQADIDTATATANAANATAQQANATAQQALDIASSAGGLVAYLDNDYQSIPTDAGGNYTTFPECSSKITVFYNSNDVSAQCTYATAVTAGVTGSWNNSTRTYTATGLSADSGTITITAAYNNTSLSKKFTVIKVRQGISGTNGHNGENGRGISSMEEYYAISESNTEAPDTWSINVIAPTESNPYLWNYNRIVYDDNTQEDSQPRVIGNYARNGTDGQPGQNGQNGQNGRGITSITEHYGLSNSTTTEPTSWSDTMQVPTSSAKYLWNYETIAYTDGTSENTSKRIIGNFGADGESAYNYELILSDVAIVKDGEGNITPQTITMTAKRGQGTSTPGNYAGRFKVEVTTNGTSYTTAYTSSANEATHTYTPTGNEKNIRVSLYLAGGTSTLLDSQNIPIVSDGADGFSPTVVSNKADGVTTVTITDANGTRSFTVNDGTDGASIATVTNYYLASASATGVTTSTSGWSTNPTSSSTTITKDKPYLWNYEVSKDNNGKTITTTTPSVIGHFGSDGTNGTNGTNGKDGKGIASIEEYYAIFSSPTSAPSDSQFTKNVVAPTSTSRYLWNYEVVTYTDGSSDKTDKRVIGVYGDPGTSIKTIDNYYLASASATGVTTSTSGWTKDPTNANATISEEKPYLWSYEVTKDNNDQVITTTDPAVIGHYGQTGATGKGIKSIAEYYALSNTTTAPDDSSFGLAVKTPSISNRYLWNYEKITYTDDTFTTTSKHIIGVYGDPATTVVLTNESYTFPGDVSNALASSFDCSVFAYSGTTRVSAKIGTITGLPSKGLSVTITNNETTTAKITVSATTELTLQSGTLTIPITVEGKTFTKKLAWSVAYRGRTGEGTPARSYFLDLSSKSVKFGENLRYFPSVLTAKSYYRDGASTSQLAYTGYIGVQVCIGTTWSTVKNFNASTVSLSLVSDSTATRATINDSNELTLPLNSTAIRFQLKATSSSTVYFDQQDTIILIDIESLTQEAIFNKLTNNSRDQGVYLENGKVYINAEYIQSWIMKLGGANNRNGFLDVYDANGNLVGYWTKDGIKLGGTLTDVHASTDAPNTLIDVNGKIETKRLVASENIKIDGVPQAGIIGSSYDGYFIFPFGWSLYKDDDNYGKFELTENGLDIDTGYGTHIKAGSGSCALSIEDDASEITTFIRNDEIVLNQDEDGDGVTYVGKETHINTDEIRILEGLTNPEQAVMTTDYIGIGGVTKATSDAYMAKNGHVFGSQFGVASATTDHIASYKFVSASNGEPAQYKLADSAFKSFMKIRTVSDSVTVTKDSYADSTIYLYNASYVGWYPIAIAGFRASGSSYLSVLQVYLSNGDLKYRLGCRGSSSNVNATFYADILYVRE